jgi:hypothetical protein
MRADDKDAVLDLARANLTHDELPAIEGRVEAFIRWTDPCNTKPFSGSSLQLVSDLRALLKAYQEQRRALEAASPVVPVGVSREDEAWSLAMGIPAFNDLPAQFQQDIHDAILAALRPTDTGRE